MYVSKDHALFAVAALIGAACEWDKLPSDYIEGINKVMCIYQELFGKLWVVAMEIFKKLEWFFHSL